MWTIVIAGLSAVIASAGSLPTPAPNEADATMIATDVTTPTPVTDKAPPAPISRPTQSIPFPTGPFFADNRVAGADVKLPPMPPALFPVPPVERRPTPILLPALSLTPPGIDKKTASGKTSTGSVKPGAKTTGEVMDAAAENSAETNVAVSPFVRWIAKTPDAAEIAKRTQKDYADNGTTENTLQSDDLFYTIRFPYVGSESTPPGGSAVIYSTPKK